MRLSFLFGGALGAIAAVSILSALSTAACNEASLTSGPDASPNCQEPIPIAPCKPLEAGAGCTGDLGATPTLGYDAVVDASYPEGCKLIVNNPVPDEDNQCIQAGTCACASDVDGGPLGWHCRS